MVRIGLLVCKRGCFGKAQYVCMCVLLCGYKHLSARCWCQPHPQINSRRGVSGQRGNSLAYIHAWTACIRKINEIRLCFSASLITQYGSTVYIGIAFGGPAL